VKLLVALVIVPIGILVLFAVLNALMGPTDQVPTVDTRPVTTSTTTASPPATPPPAVPPAGPGGYVNDDYTVPAPDPNPPDLPMPSTWDDIDTYLNSNPLYAQTVPVPVRCDIDQLDLTKASKSQLKSHFDALTACLMRVWGPTLAGAGFQAVRPTVTIYAGTIQTACGKMEDQNALYCAGDQQVYYASNLPDIIPAKLRGARFVVDSVVAHEFGHAIQARTGILLSESYVQQDDSQSGNDAAANDVSRRTEMQADCLAGAFLQAVAQSTGLSASDEKAVGSLFYSIGDDVLTGDHTIDGDHGWGANRQSWVQAGLTTATVGTCNTYTVPAQNVR